MRSGEVTATDTRPSPTQVLRWLESVPDPEIPVISLVELGVIRDVDWRGEVLEITMTPTYSGCPAIAVMAGDVTRCLRDHGIENLRILTRLSPPWTTGDMTETAREKLRQYGIAPPVAGTAACGKRKAAPEVACPRCGARDTEMVSRFGSTPCKSNYRCRSCLEPFEYFKCI